MEGLIFGILRYVNKAMFTLSRIAFARALKPYRTGLLFTHKNRDFGAVSVTERSCVAQISEVESRKSDRHSHYCWFARDVRRPCWWCVGGQEQEHFSLLGTKPYFHLNSSRKNSIVLTTNMAALSRGCKPRIAGLHVTSRRPRWMTRIKAFLSPGNFTLFSCKFFKNILL